MKLYALLLAALLASTAFFGLPQLSHALECSDKVWIYDDFENEELFAEPDLFAEKSFLQWGTPVCPLATKSRFLTTWIQVRIENGRTGWVKEQSLYSENMYLHRMKGRIKEYATQIAELQNILDRLKSEEAKFESSIHFQKEPDLEGFSEEEQQTPDACNVWIQGIRNQDSGSIQNLRLLYCH